MKSVKLSLLIGMGLSIVMFQNCSKVGYQIKDMSSLNGADLAQDVPVDTPTLGDNPEEPVVHQPPVDDSQPPVPPLDATCSKVVSGSSPIIYDSITESNAAEKNFAIQATNQDINYEHVGKVSNGSAMLISVKARTIASVSSFAAQQVSLNAQEMQCVSNFSASQVIAVAHKIESISNFSAKLCVSVQDLGSLHDLSADMTLYGRAEGKQAVIKEIRNVSAFISLHEIDVDSITSGSFKLRIENGHIGKLASGAGSLYLVNSSIDSINNFAGTIHLYGTSSVGSTVSSAVNVVKH